MPARHQADEARFDEIALAHNHGFDVVGELFHQRREFLGAQMRAGGEISKVAPFGAEF
jgi:hypothetical protein